MTAAARRQTTPRYELVQEEQTRPATDYLGPGRVVRMEGAIPVVEIDGKEHRAEMALAFPYEPEAEDELLVIGKRSEERRVGTERRCGRAPDEQTLAMRE